MKKILLFAITLYQKYLSPYKGYSCAYRIYHKNNGVKCTGCSGYGYKVIQRFGVITGLALLNRRLFDCHYLAEINKQKKQMYYSKQSGFVDCDLDCGDCDFNCKSNDCGDCGCDFIEDVFDKKKQTKRFNRNEKLYKNTENKSKSVNLNKDDVNI